MCVVRDVLTRYVWEEGGESTQGGTAYKLVQDMIYVWQCVDKYSGKFIAVV